jgi:aminopeptidase
MIHVNFQEVAQKIVDVCAQIKKDETVYIRGRTDNLEFCEALALQCRKRGAYPLIEVVSDDYRFRDLTETPIEVIEKAPRHFLSAIEKTDVFFSIGVEPKNPERFKNIPEEREAARRQFSKQIIELFNNHPEKRRVGMGFPTEEQAALYNIAFDEFYTMFWRAMNIDYRKLSEKAKKLANIIKNATDIHITTEKGTDLHMNIAGRRISLDDGIIDEEDMRTGNRLLNLPTGEVYVTPHEDEVEGTVIFDLAFHRGNRIEDVEVEIKNGIATPIRAKHGFSIFEDVLQKATGDRYKIGELGIGLNPEVTKAVGYVLTDEKIIGTIHLAFGENRGYGGKNESDIHWDVLVMEPTMTVNGTVLMDKGELLL